MQSSKRVLPVSIVLVKFDVREKSIKATSKVSKVLSGIEWPY